LPGGEAPRGKDKQSPPGDEEKIAKGQQKGDQSQSGKNDERNEKTSDRMDRALRLTRDLKSKDQTKRQNAQSELERMSAEEFEQLLKDYKDSLDGKQPSTDGLTRKNAKNRTVQGEGQAAANTNAVGEKGQHEQANSKAGTEKGPNGRAAREPNKNAAGN